MKDLYGVSEEGAQYRSDELVGIPPRCLKNLDRFRAAFKGAKERHEMAVLQMEHVASAKIQLAWCVRAMRRASAAERIQSFYRARLFRDIVRGINKAKIALIDETQDMATRIAVESGLTGHMDKIASKEVRLVLPFNGTAFSSVTLENRVSKLISQHIGIPKDLDNRIVRIHSCDADHKNGTLTFTLDVPFRIVPIVEELQHSVDVDVTRRTRQSPLVELIDALGGWEVTQNRSSVSAKRGSDEPHHGTRDVANSLESLDRKQHPRSAKSGAKPKK